jgi:hypothetical protein
MGKIEGAALCFNTLLLYLRETVGKMKDPRKASNNLRYDLLSVVVGAFSAFFMQNESFLEFQRQLQSRCGENNAQKLFGIDKIPTPEQIRNVLDEISVESLFCIFERVYRALKEEGYLKKFEVWGRQLLVTLDGSEYYSSKKIKCDCCSQRKSKNGEVTYFHSALLPAIVHPEESAVVSLPPEFITPQDGADKQDCETNAAKRWIASHQHFFAGQPITLLGDDLYSRQPMVEHCAKYGFNYIFVCLPQSHLTLYEWLTFMEAHGEVITAQQRKWNNGYFEIWSYRYLNQVPLRDEQPAVLVNWCEVTVTREKDGQFLYQNSWITNHVLIPAIAFQVAAAGRSRWKTENENHNVLKNRGYHLEHNFGHGQRFLSQFLLTLNLLAFLFHTVLTFVDSRYQSARQQRGTRKGFFQDLVSLTKYLLFESWEHLLDFLLDEAPPQLAPRRANSS